MSAEVTLGWNNAKLQAGARQASAMVQEASAKMSASLGAIGAAIGAGAGTFVGLRAITDATVRFDSMRLGMVSLSGSVAAATERMSELQGVAKSPGLGFEQVVDADIKLQSVGLSAGLSTRAIVEMGNALAVVGKGKADLDGVLLAITQIVSKGKVSAEEINQIAERVPQIRRVMQEAFGTADTEAIQKMGISAETFIQLMVDGFERTVPRAIVGLQGKWDNFTEAATARAADFGTAVSEQVIGPIENLTKALEESEGAFKTAGVVVGELIEGYVRLGRGAAEAAKSTGGAFLSVHVAAFQALFGGIPVVKDLTVKVETFQKALGRANEIAKAAVEIADRQAQAEKNLAKEQEKLNTECEVYAAKQALANAQMEKGAAAAKKQSDEIRKLEQTLADAQAKTSAAFASPKQQQREENKKVDLLDKQISEAEAIGDKKLALELDIQRQAALLRIGTLEQQIKSDTEQQLTTKQNLVRADVERLLANAEQVAAQEQALRLFELELAIAEAASRGQTKKVEALERERDIMQQTTRLMSELGIGYDEAAKKAEQLVNAEAKAAGRETGDSTGGRSKIYGYSQDQGDATDARTRAQSRVDESRANSEAAVRRSFGTFSEVAAAQKQKFGSVFGNAPAEQGAPKGGGSGDLLSEVQIMTKALVATTEKLDAALQ